MQIIVAQVNAVMGPCWVNSGNGPWASCMLWSLWDDVDPHAQCLRNLDQIQLVCKHVRPQALHVVQILSTCSTTAMWSVAAASKVGKPWQPTRNFDVNWHQQALDSTAGRVGRRRCVQISNKYQTWRAHRLRDKFVTGWPQTQRAQEKIIRSAPPHSDIHVDNIRY